LTDWDLAILNCRPTATNFTTIGDIPAILITRSMPA
jgi:hypothetical protein